MGNWVGNSVEITHLPTQTTVWGTQQSTGLRSQHRIRAWLLRLLKHKLRAGCNEPLPLGRTFFLDETGKMSLEGEGSQVFQADVVERSSIDPDRYIEHCKHMDQCRATIDDPAWVEARRKEFEAQHKATWGDPAWVEAYFEKTRKAAQEARERARREGK